MSEMTTDEKRRKAVHTLRRLDNVVDDEDLDRTIAHEASIPGMVRDAAFGLDGGISHCSRCGHEASAYGDSDCDPEDFTYRPECPNCGGQVDFHAGHIDDGRVFVCEKGRPLMREVRYRCRHCDSTIIFIEKCEPKGVGND